MVPFGVDPRPYWRTTSFGRGAIDGSVRFCGDCTLELAQMRKLSLQAGAKTAGRTAWHGLVGLEGCGLEAVWDLWLGGLVVNPQKSQYVWLHVHGL